MNPDGKSGVRVQFMVSLEGPFESHDYSRDLSSLVSWLWVPWQFERLARVRAVSLLHDACGGTNSPRFAITSAATVNVEFHHIHHDAGGGVGLCFGLVSE